MSKLKFYGSSDNNFVIDGDVQDEIGCFDSFAIYKLVDERDNAVYVVGYYGPEDNTGTWMVGLQPVEEDVVAPYWMNDFSFYFEDYSMVAKLETNVEIDVYVYFEEEKLIKEWKKI